MIGRVNTGRKPRTMTYDTNIDVINTTTELQNIPNQTVTFTIPNVGFTPKIARFRFYLTMAGTYPRVTTYFIVTYGTGLPFRDCAYIGHEDTNGTYTAIAFDEITTIRRVGDNVEFDLVIDHNTTTTVYSTGGTIIRMVNAWLSE